VGVEVFVADEQADFPVEHMRWLQLAERVLGEEGVRGDAELSIIFVDERAMSDLNARFNSKEGPTDVLAFPIDEEPSEGGRSPDSGGTGPGYTPAEPSDLPTLLGDVVVCPAVANRNATEHGGTATHDGTLDDEIALLVVHGILHLMGMDHHEDDEAEAMEARERELLGKFHKPAAAP
jgi:probable rRNA maturation factor